MGRCEGPCNSGQNFLSLRRVRVKSSCMPIHRVEATVLFVNRGRKNGHVVIIRDS